jgi:hypothetical protein
MKKLTLDKIVPGKGEKKWTAHFTRNGRKITRSFGARGMEDYTMHKDKKRRMNYVRRHMKDLRTKDPTRAGFLSMFLLWGESTSLRLQTAWYRKQLKRYNESGSIAGFRRSAAAILKRGVRESERLSGGRRNVSARRKVNVAIRSSSSSSKKSSSKRPSPVDSAMYARVKQRVYNKIPTHSAYRSGIVVKKYKEAFAKKYGPRRSPYTGTRPQKKGLARWFKEKWRNQRGEVGYAKRGDVYRPTRRITKKTPTTFGELSKRQIRAAQREKKTKGRVRNFKR